MSVVEAEGKSSEEIAAENEKLQEKFDNRKAKLQVIMFLTFQLIWCLQFKYLAYFITSYLNSYHFINVTFPIY